MSYSDNKYGLVRRVLIQEPDDTGATGVSAGMISVSRKSKLYKFGIIPTTMDMVASTTTTFVLETDAGTDLATFTPGGGTLGTGTATGKSFTATTVAAGKVLRVNVTEAGSSGSVLYFVDLKEQFDATSNTDDALV